MQTYLACGSNGLHEGLLGGREGELVEVAGGLAVGVLAHAEHDDIGATFIH